MRSSIYLSLVALFLLANVSSFAAQADKSYKKVKVKCYVELFGGRNTIVYQMAKSDKVSKVATSLTNRSVLTTLSDKKMKVYQVNECVLDSDDFASLAAKSTEKNTAK